MNVRFSLSRLFLVSLFDVADNIRSGLVNANEAFSISLVEHDADGLKTVGTFGPRFTYPIFGDEEHIFGYKDLKINLRYHASDMRPHVQISSSKKFKAVGDIEPVDVKGILQEHLPPGKPLHPMEKKEKKKKKLCSLFS